MTNAHRVELSRVFPCKPEKLYGIWTNQDHLKKWMGVEVEAVVELGGPLNFNFEGEPTTLGHFKELKPHERVAFTWNSPGCSGNPTGDTLVTISLEPVSEGTKMTLVHTGFISEESCKDHLEGWTEYYDSWEKLISEF